MSQNSGLFPLNTYQEFTNAKLTNQANYQIDLKSFYEKIDKSPDLVGSGVIYINDHYESVRLRPVNLTPMPFGET